MLTGAAMFIAYVKVAIFGVPLPSVPVIVTFTAPAAVGVPLKMPAVVRLRPAGNPAELPGIGAVPPRCGRGGATTAPVATPFGTGCGMDVMPGRGTVSGHLVDQGANPG